MSDQADTLKKITSGKKMHNFEILAGLLKNMGQPIPVALVKKFRRFEWSTAMRYETGRTPTGETRGFLKAAKETCDWVRGMLP